MDIGLGQNPPLWTSSSSICISQAIFRMDSMLFYFGGKILSQAMYN